MNGWTFAAITVVCLTVLAVALLWAVVRASLRTEPSAAEEGHGPEAKPVDVLQRQIEAAAERAQREGRGEW